MLTIEQFAARIGAMTKELRDAADPFHVAYKGGTPEQQADLRHRWMLAHLTGQKLDTPERILSRGKGKGASKAHILAIDRAYSDFRYYVVRPVKAPVKAKKSAEGAGKVDPVADLLEAFNALSKAQQKRFLSSI